MPIDMTAELNLRPLSAAQAGIWVAQMLEPHSPVFNVGKYIEILGPVDPGRFETALRQVVAETDALHLRVIETDNGPRQYIKVDPGWIMPYIDVSAEDDPQAVAETWMHDDWQPSTRRCPRADLRRQSPKVPGSSCWTTRRLTGSRHAMGVTVTTGASSLPTGRSR